MGGDNVPPPLVEIVLRGHIVLGGDNVPPLVEIGLTDLKTKWGGGHESPRPPPELHSCQSLACISKCLLFNLLGFKIKILSLHFWFRLSSILVLFQAAT